jgi:hypothetical protein
LIGGGREIEIRGDNVGRQCESNEGKREAGHQS